MRNILHVALHEEAQPAAARTSLLPRRRGGSPHRLLRLSHRRHQNRTTVFSTSEQSCPCTCRTCQWGRFVRCAGAVVLTGDRGREGVISCNRGRGGAACARESFSLVWPSVRCGGRAVLVPRGDCVDPRVARAKSGDGDWSGIGHDLVVFLKPAVLYNTCNDGLPPDCSSRWTSRGPWGGSLRFCTFFLNGQSMTLSRNKTRFQYQTRYGGT